MLVTTRDRDRIGLPDLRIVADTCNVQFDIEWIEQLITSTIGVMN